MVGYTPYKLAEHFLVALNYFGVGPDERTLDGMLSESCWMALELYSVVSSSIVVTP